MTSEHSRVYIVSLLHELCALPREPERVPFMAIGSADPCAPPKLMRYLPFWASSPREGRA